MSPCECASEWWGIDQGELYTGDNITLTWFSANDKPTKIRIDILNDKKQWKKLVILKRKAIADTTVVSLNRKTMRGWRVVILSTNTIPKLWRVSTIGYPTKTFSLNQPHSLH